MVHQARHNHLELEVACFVEGSRVYPQFESSAGVPLTVARQMLPSSAFLVGSFARDATAASTAASDGANFVILQPAPGAGSSETLEPSVLQEVAKQQRSKLQIPLLVSAAAMAPADTDAWLQQGPDGIAGTAADLNAIAASAPANDSASQMWPPTASAGEAVSVLLRGLKRRGWAEPEPEMSTGDTAGSKGTGLLTELVQSGSPVDIVLNREKALMPQIIEFLQEAVPDMDEVKLLRDALAGASALSANHARHWRTSWWWCPCFWIGCHLR